MIQLTISGTKKSSTRFCRFLNFPLNFYFTVFHLFFLVLLLSITSRQLFFHLLRFLHRNFFPRLSSRNKNTLEYKKKRSSLVFLYPTRENRLITVSRRSQLIMEWIKSFSAPQPLVLCCVENNSKTVYCTARNDWVGGEAGERQSKKKVSPHNHHCIVIAISQTKKRTNVLQALKIQSKVHCCLRVTTCGKGCFGVVVGWLEHCFMKPFSVCLEIS